MNTDPDTRVAWMDDKHPDFDLVMELLCSLPSQERFAVPIPLLRADLLGDGFRDIDIRELMNEARARGFLVDTYKGDNAFIYSADWVKTKNACLQYMAKVYG